MLRDARLREVRKVAKGTEIYIVNTHFHPEHTTGDTVTFVEGDGVLFSGDLAMKGLFPAFATPQSRSDTWLASLDEMARTEFAAKYPDWHQPLRVHTAATAIYRELQ